MEYEIESGEARKVEDAFTYHPPTPDQPKRYERIRAEAKQFALMLLRTCPPGRERSLAMTNLEQAVMWANAAIARNEKPPTTSRRQAGLLKLYRVDTATRRNLEYR